MFPSLNSSHKYNQSPPQKLSQQNSHIFHHQQKKLTHHQAKKKKNSSNNHTRGEREGENERKVRVKKITTALKPPHRYKTKIIVNRQFAMLFGGLGCEKNLTWAKLNFHNYDWEFPKEPINNYSYHPHVPIFGHSLIQYKNKAIVFGGANADDLNEVSIIDLKSMKYKQGSRSPFRRRCHACCVVGRYMIIHGGIEAGEVQSQVMIYDIEGDRWYSPSCLNFPSLSHHQVVYPQSRRQKKIKALDNESLYIFGGLNEKGVSQNRMYKIKFNNENDVIAEKVSTANTPEARYSFCLEPFDSNTLFLYGGRNHDEINGPFASNGIFSDVYLYNIQTCTWTMPKLSFPLENRFGMCSYSFGRKIYVFGGSLENTYVNADIHLFSLMREERKDIGTEISLPTTKKLYDCC